MYRHLPRNLEEKLEDNVESYRWLKCGDIKGGTESTIVAAEDRAISTNSLKNGSLKDEMDSKWRPYKHHKKSSDYLNSRCSMSVMNEYFRSHNKKTFNRFTTKDAYTWKHHT